MGNPRTGKTVDSDREKRACYEGDDAILGALRENGIGSGALLLIINGDAEDVEFKSLPKVCRKYRCIRKEMLWNIHNESPPALVQTLTSIANIDAILSSHASYFFGNMYSTMSEDIVYSRFSQHKHAAFFNRHCSLFFSFFCP